MTKIRSYSGFRSINELDTTGTYLDRSRNKYAQAEYPKFRKMFGKVFKDSPTTSGVDYGLKYEGEDYEFDLNSDIFYEWNVIFPDDFYKHFVPKGENLEEWKKDNKDIVKELMDNLNSIRIKAEGGLNRTHFPGGIPNDLKGLGLGYIIYEGLVRYLGYASSRPDASNAAQKVWSQIAEDPDFVGIVSNNMILVFRKDFEHKGEVLAKALDHLGINVEEIEDNQDVEKFLSNNNIDISEELLDIDFMANFKENIADAKKIREEYNLRYEAERAARRLKERLFGDPTRFKETGFDLSDDLRFIKEKIAEIKEYMKDMKPEKLVDILKSNDLEVKKEQIESKIFMDKLESLLKQDFTFYINSRVRIQVGNAIKEMKDIIIKNLRLSVEGMEAIVKELQTIYDSKYKEILESQEDELDLKWVAEHTNFNSRITQNLLIGIYGNKYTFKFEIGRQEYFKSVLMYDNMRISPTKIPLDIIQLFKYFIIETGLKTTTNTDAFVESKKADLEKIDILISKDYKWAGNAFTKLKLGQDIENVVLKPIEHLELVKKLKLTDQAMKMKNAYKYLAKGLQKAYLEGGYAKALELYDTEVKKKLEYIDVDVFDDPDYGLFKDRRPDAKYSAQEHIERRLKAYKEAESFKAARERIQANIDAATNKVNSHIDKSAEAALAKINSRNATQAQAPTPKQAQVQKKAQEELEKKPIEKRSFIKRFMDFFN